MSKKSFYKSYLKLKNFLYILPYSRILKFKRPKWKNLQLQLQKLKQKKKFFKFDRKFKYHNSRKMILEYKGIANTKLYYDQTAYTFCALYKKYHLKKFFKLSLDFKNSMFLFFDNNVSIRYYKDLELKKIVDREDFFLKVFIKPLYILESFLWKLCIFSSKQEIKQQIFYEKIKVNSKKVGANTFLQKGDIITVDSTNELKKIQRFSTFLGLFCEVDYYTNSIIILENYQKVNKDLLLHLYPEILNASLLTDYIRNK